MTVYSYIKCKTTVLINARHNRDNPFDTLEFKMEGPINVRKSQAYEMQAGCNNSKLSK